MNYDILFVVNKDWFEHLNLKCEFSLYSYKVIRYISLIT